MTNFQCVLLAGGLLKDDAYHQELLSQAKTIICADSGANEVLRLGFKPDYVVGDLDSLHPQNLEMLKTVLIHYPRERLSWSYYALQGSAVRLSKNSFISLFRKRLTNLC